MVYSNTANGYIVVTKILHFPDAALVLHWHLAGTPSLLLSALANTLAHNKHEGVQSSREKENWKKKCGLYSRFQVKLEEDVSGST